MNNQNLLVSERARDIGGFLVGRLLPFRQKRQVGPFTFIDHMGPSILKPGQYMDVDQHPHIGLSTLTYLFEGSIKHKDSTGAEQVIHPGDVGFMTSGAGVTHTERTPRELRDAVERPIHGYQIWVALPKEYEEMEPNFQYISADQLPTCSYNGMQIKMVAGTGFGLTSPLNVYSPLFMIEVSTTEANILEIKGQLEGEIAIVVVQGGVQASSQHIEPGSMLISQTENECHISLEANTKLLLFGGTPLPEERFLLWNFVSHSKERLQKAKQDWEAKLFPVVPGDDTYIPFPPTPKQIKQKP